MRPEGSGHYLKLGVGPLVQWLGVRVVEPRTRVDFGWHSNPAAKAALAEDEGIWRAFMGVRCQPMAAASPGVGTPWRPTFTEEPGFHGARAFGHLIFLDGA